MSARALRKDLLKRVKKDGLEYGIVVRVIGKPGQTGAERTPYLFFGGPAEPTIGPLVEAWRVYLDGREERIRNVEFRDLGPGSFRYIVAAGKQSAAYNLGFSPPEVRSWSGPGEVPISVVVPDLLFQELTLRTPSAGLPRLPASPHPFFEE
jgi:hypothetical protein